MSYNNFEKLAAMMGSGSVADAAAKKMQKYREIRKFRMTGGVRPTAALPSIADVAAKKTHMYRNLQKFQR
jgi:hypothetical protein